VGRFFFYFFLFLKICRKSMNEDFPFCKLISIKKIFFFGKNKKLEKWNVLTEIQLKRHLAAF
jgi:hypothetical protein